jgi:hypothetical protein
VTSTSAALRWEADVAAPTVKLLSSVVITAANNAFRVTEGATSYTAEIVPGTYYLAGDNSVLAPGDLDADDLVRAVWAAAGLGSAGGWVALYTASHRVKMYSDAGVWSIDWDNALTTFDATILGVDDVSAAFGASAEEYATTDHQHKHAWFATQAVEWVDGDDQSHQVHQSRAKSGRLYTHSGSEVHTDRPIRHAYEPDYKAKEIYDEGHVNESFQAFWRTVNLGQTIRHYPDATDGDDYFEGVAMGETLTGSSPTRYRHGAPIYSWQVLLGAYV